MRKRRHALITSTLAALGAVLAMTAGAYALGTATVTTKEASWTSSHRSPTTPWQPNSPDLPTRHQLALPLIHLAEAVDANSLEQAAAAYSAAQAAQAAAAARAAQSASSASSAPSGPTPPPSTTTPAAGGCAPSSEAVQEARAEAAGVPCAWVPTAICEEQGYDDANYGFFGIQAWGGFGGYPSAGSAPLGVQLGWESAHGQPPPDAPGQCHGY
jgi:hypothetical protein